MTDIIEELFDSPIYRDYIPSEELKALRRQEADLWQKVLPLLGLDVIDEISDTQSAIAREAELRWFRQGIHLGASLMLELLG